MLKKIKLMIYLYILAIHGILVYLLVPPPPVQREEPTFSAIEKDCSQVKEIPKESKPPKLLTVKILPHPPNFLEAREIQFLSYQTIEENSRKKVVFKEFSQGKYIDTKVDSEAIQWK